MARNKQTQQIRLILGPYQTWSLACTTGTQQVERSTWKCGCSLDCVGNGRNNRGLFVQWNRCEGHQQVGDQGPARRSAAPAHAGAKRRVKSSRGSSPEQQ